MCQESDVLIKRFPDLRNLTENRFLYRLQLSFEISLKVFLLQDQEVCSFGFKIVLHHGGNRELRFELLRNDVHALMIAILSNEGFNVLGFVLGEIHAIVFMILIAMLFLVLYLAPLAQPEAPFGLDHSCLHFIIC